MAKKKAAKKSSKKVKVIDVDALHAKLYVDAKGGDPYVSKVIAHTLSTQIANIMPEIMPNTRESIKNIAAQIKIDVDRGLENLKKELGDICTELFLLGISSVTVTYSGEGDSGDIDSCVYMKVGGKGKLGSVSDELDQRLRTAVWDLLPSGFENNDGGYGDARINTARREITINHGERYVETREETTRYTI